jgi:hypothetical protein
VPRVRLREPHPEPPAPLRPGPAELPEGPPGPAGRYRLEGEIARGGMGAILRGRDTALGREVAVKVLLETHRGRTELVQRFVEEAQIAGQLQHPGVPPVYELGQFGDRRPYFAMKLVRGQTLAALLAARPDLAEDRPRFVGIFEQVCQTLPGAVAEKSNGREGEVVANSSFPPGAARGTTRAGGSGRHERAAHRALVPAADPFAFAAMAQPESTCWTVIEAAAAGRAGDREDFARRYAPVVRAYLSSRRPCGRWWPSTTPAPPRTSSRSVPTS